MVLCIILAVLLCVSLLLLSGRALSSRQVTRIAQSVSVLVLALVAMLPLLMTGDSQTWLWSVPITANVRLAVALHYDMLVWVMGCAVSLLNLIIQSYSARYLYFDQNQRRFIGQLFLLVFSVMLLVMSGGLLTAFIAWQLIGLSLYLLLNHYHYDVRANKAAKKKFMINRVGDISFLLAVILTLHQHGTTVFAELLQAGVQLNTSILALIFIAVMTKSAQFPFHIWLIDTMEAPTPVSALMHAGVINAGGFLLARLSPFYIGSVNLLIVIAAVGSITLLLGVYFMQQQPDVKKKLAYSTMSQMGYMVLQCGLGCFSSAVFHLIAHGFLKATAFLSSGSTLTYDYNRSASLAVNRRKRIALHMGSFIITVLLLALGFSVVLYLGLGKSLSVLIGLFIAITMHQLVYAILNQAGVGKKIVALLILSIIFLVYLLLLNQLSSLLQNAVTDGPLLTVSMWSFGFIVGLSVLYGLWRWWSPATLTNLRFHKAGIEYAYRHYVINPLRRYGDCLLDYYQNTHRVIQWVLVLIPILLAVISLVHFYLAIDHIVSAVNFPLMVLSLTMLAITLVVANRVVTLPQLVITLVIMVLSLTGLAFTLGEYDMGAIGFFQLINGSVLIIGFALFLFEHSGRSLSVTVTQNRQPWGHFYMSVFLMLLIGVPGTASFIGEFYLLSGLLKINFLAAVFFGANMLLLALIVLHTLQVHFFNPKAIAEYAVPVSPLMHAVAITAIGFNIFNGLYPAIFLRVVLSLLGGVSHGI